MVAAKLWDKKGGAAVQINKKMPVTAATEHEHKENISTLIIRDKKGVVKYGYDLYL